MLPITAIILTKDEELHIGRCLERLQPLEAERIVVVDSESTDATCRIAREHGAEVVVNPWPGNQAAQFNWALDNLDISTEWVLRLDADEYLSDALIEELRTMLPSLSTDVSALVFPLGRVFMGRELRHGIVNGVSMVRMFRNGRARYEQRLMDEHLKISSGQTVTCRNKFFDDNLNDISFFVRKHDSYSAKEAFLQLDKEYGLTLNQETTHEPNSPQESSPSDNGHFAESVSRKRQSKDTYARMPLFFRAFAYFVYRYIIKLGFLDGKEGFIWDFMQGWWYRTLVDSKVLEIKRDSHGDPAKMRRLLRTRYGLRF